MKLLLSLVILSAANAAPAQTCWDQQPCVAMSIEEVEEGSPTCSGGCEFRVCWRQIRNADDGSCLKDGSFSHIGDQFQDSTENEDGLNCPNGDGWDDTCNNAPEYGFEQHCQNVPAGGWARLLVKDGGGCDVDGTYPAENEVTISNEAGNGLEISASCYPSDFSGQNEAVGATVLSDAPAAARARFLRALARGGKQAGGGGGTCSGNQEGKECIWTLQVPATCGGGTEESIPIDVPDITSAPTIAPVVSESTTLPPVPGSKGDPHFKTWRNEHFEYHGQCDLILAKDTTFADGLGLQVQIRTKLIRFWSYIKSAAIRIGDDIFELEGFVDGDKEDNYWINLQPQGELKTLGGFPITRSCPAIYKCLYEIDLSSKYPGQSIKISFFKEFVSVDFANASAESFGNIAGILGNYNSGKTLARDGVTEIHDFTKLGNEWQVLPFEDMLFHDVSEPQFPQRCMEPEDPRGERRRQLGEESVTTEQAEKACAGVKDPADRKFCVYDILATQDMDMVGAY